MSTNEISTQVHTALSDFRDNRDATMGWPRNIKVLWWPRMRAHRVSRRCWRHRHSALAQCPRRHVLPPLRSRDHRRGRNVASYCGACGRAGGRRLAMGLLPARRDWRTYDGDHASAHLRSRLSVASKCICPVLVAHHLSVSVVAVCPVGVVRRRHLTPRNRSESTCYHADRRPICTLNNKYSPNRLCTWLRLREFATRC